MVKTEGSFSVVSDCLSANHVGYHNVSNNTKPSPLLTVTRHSPRLTAIPLPWKILYLRSTLVQTVRKPWDSLGRLSPRIVRNFTNANLRLTLSGTLLEGVPRVMINLKRKFHVKRSTTKIKWNMEISFNN